MSRFTTPCPAQKLKDHFPRFALLVIPHYANESREGDRPFALPNEGAMTWQWLNTVNRVNTQVKKVSPARYL